jgi:LysR family glycine cleavage system transcriptional activator
MSSRLPPLNSLRAFEAAARHLSFKRAAEELAVTPTAVSHQIRSLEAFLELPLFRRLTRALELTPEGEAMLPKVREGFSALAAAIEAVRRRDSSGIVTVCAPPSFAARWLVPRLGSLARAHPDIDLRLSSSLSTIDSRDRGSFADAGSDAGGDAACDLTIRFGRGNYANCTVEPLFSPLYVAVCSPALLCGEHPLREPADLRWHALIRDATVPELDDRPGWEQWLDLAGVTDREGLSRGPSFTDASLAIEAAIAGHGVALAGRPMVSADIAAGRLAMPFSVAIPSRFGYFVTAPLARAERPAVLALRAWLVREAARECPDKADNLRIAEASATAATAVADPSTHTVAARAAGSAA